MCTQYICSSCQIYFFDHCDQVELEPQHACGYDSRIYRAYKDCDACVLIHRAIEKLRHLIWRFDFLKTEGLAGIEGLAQWEQEEARLFLFKDLTTNSFDWAAQVESREERRKALSNIQNMGLSGIDDKRDEHQSFGSTPVQGTDKHHFPKDKTIDATTVVATSEGQNIAKQDLNRV